MPPIKTKMMKCKLCSKLVDSVDISSHANMHRQQGDLKPAASSTSTQIQADTITADQPEHTPGVSSGQVNEGERLLPAEQQPQSVECTNVAHSSTATDNYKSARHLFVAEMVAGLTEENQQFSCILCQPTFSCTSLDVYCEHITQHSHMQNVFLWLLVADADVVSKYQVLASKIKVSKKSSGLFCELCRKASFNVGDVNSHKSHLTSNKHQSTVTHVKNLYKEVCEKFADSQTSKISPVSKLGGPSSSSTESNTEIAKGGQPSKRDNSNIAPTSRDCGMANVSPTAASKDNKVSASIKSDTLNVSKETKAMPNDGVALKSDNYNRNVSDIELQRSHPGFHRRSPSWSPIRNATPPETTSTQTKKADIEIVSIVENKSSADRHASSSSRHHESRNSDGSHSLGHRSSGSQRHTGKRSRTPDLRQRLTSSSKGRGRSPSPRRRRSRSSSRGRRGHRHNSVSRQRSPGRDDVSNYRRNSSKDRQTQQCRTRSRSPGYRRSRRRSRSHESKGRHRSPNRTRRERSWSRDRHYRRQTRSPILVPRPKKFHHGRRLQPRPLSPWSIDSLTFLVEKKWTAYYEKYYAPGSRDDLQALLFQKEYLQAYKGFFMDDPNFVSCYSYLLKPEELRTMLTEKIDRGSPGPAPLDPVITNVHRLGTASSVSLESGELVDGSRSRESRTGRSEQSILSNHSYLPSCLDPRLADNSFFLPRIGDPQRDNRAPYLPNSVGPSLSNRAPYSPRSIEGKRDDRRSGIRRSVEQRLGSEGLFSARSVEERRSNRGSYLPRSVEPKTDHRISYSSRSVEQKLDDRGSNMPRSAGPHFLSHDMTQPSHSQTMSEPAVSAPKTVPPAARSADSFHSFAKLKALIREKLKIPTNDEEKGLSTIQVPDLVKEALQQINSDKEKDNIETHATTSASDDGELIFSDPFLGFVHNVLSGILKMTGLQDEVDAGNAPAGARSQLYLEQKRMHDSMVKPEGHLLIRMARMALTNPSRLESKFGVSHVHVVEILKNLDRDVLQLIADTPMLKQ